MTKPRNYSMLIHRFETPQRRRKHVMNKSDMDFNYLNDTFLSFIAGHSTKQNQPNRATIDLQKSKSLSWQVKVVQFSESFPQKHHQYIRPESHTAAEQKIFPRKIQIKELHGKKYAWHLHGKENGVLFLALLDPTVLLSLVSMAATFLGNSLRHIDRIQKPENIFQMMRKYHDIFLSI